MSTTEKSLPTADEANVELEKMHRALRENFVDYSVENTEVEGRHGYEFVTTFTLTGFLPENRLRLVLDIVGAYDGWNAWCSPAGLTATFRWDPYQDAA